jgi:hypothetical protein
VSEEDLPIPQPGEIWVVGGIRNMSIGAAHGHNIQDYYSNWGQVNGKEVRVLSEFYPDSPGKAYKIRLVESEVHLSILGDDGIWCVVSRCYLTERRTDRGGHRIFAKRKTCCQPSAGLCQTCKAEFRLEMLEKGKVYDPWTKLWQKQK